MAGASGAAKASGAPAAALAPAVPEHGQPVIAQSLLARWGRLMARHSRLVVLLWLVPIVAGGLAYQGLQEHLATPDFTTRNSDSDRAEELVAERFGVLGAEQDAVVFRSTTFGAADPQFQAVVSRVVDAVAARPGVASVVSPYDLLNGGQLSSDGHVALALVGLTGGPGERARLSETLHADVESATRGSGVRGVETYLTGSSPLSNDLATVELHDQHVAESIGVPLALIVLLFALGSLVAAAMPVLLALASVVTTAGVLSLVAEPLGLDQFAIVVTSMIGLGVGIDYALFIVSRFREQLEAGRSSHPASPDSGRHRGGRRRGNRASPATVEDAVATALDTSGRTIVIAGVIVVAAVGSTAVIEAHVFFEIAFTTGLVVACSLLANLTLLPAALAWLGDRVDAVPIRRRRRSPPNHPRHGPGNGQRSPDGWARWARLVLRRPVAFGLPAVGLLVLLALPLPSMRLGLDLGLVSLADTPSGRGAQIVADSFGAGAVAPVQVVVCAPDRTMGDAELSGLAQLTAFLRADHRVDQAVAVTDLLYLTTGRIDAAAFATVAARPDLRPTLSRLTDLPADDGDRAGAAQCALLTAVLAIPIDSPAATQFIADVRAVFSPVALTPSGATSHVGGLTAQYTDLATETTGKLPLVVGIVLVLSLGYLTFAFRSILLPVKAVVLNLLATASAVGLTIFVFQDGHGERLFGFTSVGSLQAFLPVALFALLFGLSMDYEMFLVRRMREEWLLSGDTAEAVIASVARTARPISAAAAIMASVFGAFLFADALELKQMGFALAVAILLDATVVRLLLVPAFMGMAGAANWWLPAAFRRGRTKDAQGSTGTAGTGGTAGTAGTTGTANEVGIHFETAQPSALVDPINPIDPMQDQPQYDGDHLRGTPEPDYHQLTPDWPPPPVTPRRRESGRDENFSSSPSRYSAYSD